MAVVTITQAQDVQVDFVHRALERLGETSVVYVQTSVIGAGDIAVEPGPDPYIRLGQFSGNISDVKAFWNRRNPRVILYPSEYHIADKHQATDCSIHVLDGIRYLLDLTFAVNPASSVVSGQNKILQLQVAAQLDIPVPETLVTSVFRDVLSFLERNDVVCVKPLGFYTWVTDKAVSKSSTVIIDSAEYLNQRSVEACPLIYQRFVAKVAEARIVAFGDYMAGTLMRVGGKIDASDWRRTDPLNLKLERLEIPQRIRHQIQRLKSRLRLRFGVFEYLIDERGDWYFIEVNQAGQFAWQEHLCPEVKLVEPFARYLIAANDGFSWNEKSARDDLSVSHLIAERPSIEPPPFMQVPLPADDPYHRPVTEAGSGS